MADNIALSIIDRKVINNNDTGVGIDLGAFNTAEVQVRVHVSGAGTLQLQHAAVDEDLAYLEIGSTVSLASVDATGAVRSLSDFLRYVRYTATSVEGSPVVSIDVIAKQ